MAGVLADVAELFAELILDLLADRRYGWAVRFLGLALVVGGVATVLATSLPVVLSAALVVVGLVLLVVPTLATIAFGGD